MKNKATPKFLDTRPKRDASHQTEVVKRAATIALHKRPTGKPVVEASTYTDFVGGTDYRRAAFASKKPDQIELPCSVPIGTAILNAASIFPSHNTANLRQTQFYPAYMAANPKYRKPCCKTCGATHGVSSKCCPST